MNFIVNQAEPVIDLPRENECEESWEPRQIAIQISKALVADFRLGDYDFMTTAMTKAVAEDRANLIIREFINHYRGYLWAMALGMKIRIVAEIHPANPDTINLRDESGTLDKLYNWHPSIRMMKFKHIPR